MINKYEELSKSLDRKLQQESTSDCSTIYKYSIYLSKITDDMLEENLKPWQAWDAQEYHWYPTIATLTIEAKTILEAKQKAFDYAEKAGLPPCFVSWFWLNGEVK